MYIYYISEHNVCVCVCDYIYIYICTRKQFLMVHAVLKINMCDCMRL